MSATERTIAMMSELAHSMSSHFTIASRPSIAPPQNSSGLVTQPKPPARSCSKISRRKSPHCNPSISIFPPAEQSVQGGGGERLLPFTVSAKRVFPHSRAEYEELLSEYDRVWLRAGDSDS